MKEKVWWRKCKTEKAGSRASPQKSRSRCSSHARVEGRHKGDCPKRLGRYEAVPSAMTTKPPAARRTGLAATQLYINGGDDQELARKGLGSRNVASPKTLERTMSTRLSRSVACNVYRQEIGSWITWIPHANKAVGACNTAFTLFLEQPSIACRYFPGNTVILALHT